eukprot:CAMPEP_0115873536 /NCGR_PEP_ID=MMETSP0287-20121206/24046_1 /TAXON_ID=412157 /ORGANISM="Chrysochromulina rotalis, Strain UIO044" /LENGTH=281 /DNA_ID=CAMNT_0003328599 /DNA_START=1 /DNA_END=846 /DNA_ORIENTATION=-
MLTATVGAQRAPGVGSRQTIMDKSGWEAVLTQTPSRRMTPHELMLPRCKIYGRPKERELAPPDISICSASTTSNSSSPTAGRDRTTAGEHGAWKLDVDKCYLLDMGVVKAVGNLVSRGTMIEFGAGNGCYARAFAHATAVRVRAAIDGAQGVEVLSGGVVTRADLSRPIHQPAEWVFSLETGEHIPTEFEGTFLSNVASNAACGVVLSWAVPHQPGVGHVNGRPRAWVASEMAKRGFQLEADETARLQASASLWFLNRNMQVFRRLGSQQNSICRTVHVSQ